MQSTSGVPSAVMSALTTASMHAREAHRASRLARALARAGDRHGCTAAVGDVVHSLGRAGPWLAADAAMPAPGKASGAGTWQDRAKRAAWELSETLADLEVLCAVGRHDPAAAVWRQAAQLAVDLRASVETAG